MAHSRRGLKEDRISQLPDPLICQIVSHLGSTRKLVETSVLSSRWRSLWLEVASLKLDSQYFPDFHAFTRFGDRFFDSNRMSCIDKLKLVLYEDGDEDEYKGPDESRLTSWIDAATKRKLQHLEAIFASEVGVDHRWQMPISLYTCETLVSLKLCEVVLPDAGFVSLPSLKTMHLKDLVYPDEATFERLVSCSPVLQVLKISGYDNFPKVFRVHSLSLKRLEAHLQNCQLVIDAPLLGVLEIQDDDPGRYVVKNLASSFKLQITFFCAELVDEATVSSKRKSIRDFLRGISKVGEMIMYEEKTFKLLHHYSKLEPLPQFVYMSRLYAEICPTDLKWLPAFLGCCPNLKSLEVGWFYTGTVEPLFEQATEFSFSSVPECSLSSLESIHIRGMSENAADMKLVRYFLENSIILKKLTLDLRHHIKEKAILKKLLEIPRRSITCQVVAL